MLFFRIEADFEDKVGDGEQENNFKNTLRTQLARIHNCDMKPCETGSDLCCINKLKVEKGSILVYFKLVGTESEEIKLESAYKEFMNLLQSGKFTLVNQTSFHILHLTEKWFTHFA